MIKAHKIALDLNDHQLTACSKAAGCARVAYNWALDEWKAQYSVGGKPNEIALRRLLNSLKHEEFPWMSESS
jgi:putative transposase